MVRVEYIVCYSDNTWNTYTSEYDRSKSINDCMTDIKAICTSKLDNLVGVYLYGYEYID